VLVDLPGESGENLARRRWLRRHEIHEALALGRPDVGVIERQKIRAPRQPAKESELAQELGEIDGRMQHSRAGR
jgi:hypothetical protein